MTSALLRDLATIFGASNVIGDPKAVAVYAFDKYPRYLLERPAANIPAAVVKPDPERYPLQLPELIAYAKEQEKKIVARGGGSGVCGAAVARNGPETILVDMSRLCMLDMDAQAKQITAGAGALGSHIEQELNKHGRTLGHSPASLAISTPGGWVAARSSGQFSSRFGTIENLVREIEVIHPDGMIRTITGHEVSEYLRMEGTNGIITKVTMPVHLPLRHKIFRVMVFRDGSEQAFGALPILMQLRQECETQGVSISAVRLFDLFDWAFVTKPYEKKIEHVQAKKYLAEKMLLRYPGLANAVMQHLGGKRFILVVMLESDNTHQLDRMRDLLDQCLSGIRKGQNLSEDIGRNWYANRYKLTYDALAHRYRQGIIADTFDFHCDRIEVLEHTYRNLKLVLREKAVSGAHFGFDRKHFYGYLTWAARGGLEAYDDIWHTILRTCCQSGAATTHHHGIGSLKAGAHNTLAQHAYGNDWLRWAAQIKKRLDPENLFNPNNIF